MITNDALRVYYKQWSWQKQAEDRAHLFTPERGYYTVEETRAWITLLCEVNGLGIVDLQRMVTAWLLKTHHKKNCLYIYGHSNTCKTKFARSLADGVYTLGIE